MSRRGARGCGRRRAEGFRGLLDGLEAEQRIDLFGLAVVEAEDDFAELLELCEEFEHGEEILAGAFLRVCEVEEEGAVGVFWELW